MEKMMEVFFSNILMNVDFMTAPPAGFQKEVCLKFA